MLHVALSFQRKAIIYYTSHWLGQLSKKKASKEYDNSYLEYDVKPNNGD